MSNSYYGQGEEDQWSHYQNNSKYRTDTQQRQKQERERQRAAYEARAASRPQTPDAGIDMASRNFAHMNLDGYGRPSPSSTINRTQDGRFVQENIRSHDPHRRGASDNTHEQPRPTSSASTKSSIFRGFSFSRTGTGGSSSSHKQSASAGTVPDRRRSSIKDKVQDVYRKMSSSYNKATDNFSKAVDPYVNIAKLNGHERKRWEAELRQGAEDKEEEKRRSQQSYQQQQSYPASPIATSPHPSRKSNGTFTSFDSLNRTETSQTAAPKPKKSKDLLTPGERAAVFVSKLVDPVKKRRDSDDSDMSFADIAPPAELDVCSRCEKPVTGFLTKGRCGACHALWVQEFWDGPDSPTVSGQGHEPEDTNSDYSNRSSSSSSAGILRDVNEEEYMKLAASHRIRRVRRTMYSDPGNPFSLDDYSPTNAKTLEVENIIYDPDAIPTILKRLSDTVAEPSPSPSSPISLGSNPFEEQEAAARQNPHPEQDFIMLTPSSADITTIKLDPTVYVPSPATKPSPAPSSPISLGPNPFEERPGLNASPILIRDSTQLLAPTPRRSGTPALIRDHSIPNPTPPPKDEKFRMVLSGSVRRAVGAGSHKRSETMPSGSEKRRDGKRDTRFYGFYDDVLVEYGRVAKMF